MSGINSKNKGAKNEREVCKVLQEWSGYEFSRVPQSGGLRWKKTDNITGDVICSDPKGAYRFNLSIEAKFHNDFRFEHILLPNSKVKILSFWEQAVEDSNRADREPMVWMRYNGMKKGIWFIIIRKKLFDKTKNLMEISSGYFDLILKDKELTILMSTDLTTCTYKKFIRAVKNLRKNE